MFFQDGPVLKNQYTDDPLLSDYLKKTLPKNIFKKIEPRLKQVGQDAAEKLLFWADEAERFPPKLVSFDPWGRRIDEIQVCQAWKNYDAYAAQNGIVAAAYEREFQEFSRVYQMALLYLYHPSSAFASCPLAMTDGAARTIELYGDKNLKKNAFKNLTSRDPKTFWTSGQWMTEKIGGSDVSQSETTAKKTKDGYILSGTKWFTSATTSQMAMTLARIEGAPAGNKGLSLFYLETKNSEGKLNNIEIHRLKDKLGTKALPTAELTLHSTPAQLVGGEGDGVRKISSLFNITRVYNAISSIGQARRALALAYDYAHKRKAFGKKLIDHPLHRHTLELLTQEWKKCFFLTFKTVELLGREECNKATDDEKKLLRVLTPLAKLYTAKICVQISSEVVESFGGSGYIEDTGIPRLLRDAQVLAIWEGTTNILSLDMLRAFEKEDGLEALDKDIKIRSQNNEAWKTVKSDFQNTLKLGEEKVLEQARHFALRFSDIFASSLL